MATIFKNNKGDFLKQYCFEEQGLFSLDKPRLRQITRITEMEFASEFPDTPIVFDMLEFLQDKYPTEDWVAVTK